MRKYLFGFMLLILSVGMLAAACSDAQEESAIEQRDKVFTSADSLFPTPEPVNFPLREALVKFTLRQDEINHPWFIYVLGDNGNAIGYYVGQTVPVNSCTFLSSSEKVIRQGGISFVGAAPSLDGIYYGGSGASAGCDSWFFFDAETDALIQIRGVNWYAADQPLALEAEPISIAVQ